MNVTHETYTSYLPCNSTNDMEQLKTSIVYINLHKYFLNFDYDIHKHNEYTRHFISS